jgi:mannan endo-1,4-beta-mannosidase
MNNLRKNNYLVIVGLISLLVPANMQGQTIAPVTPNATAEATALLGYLQSLSGKHTLSGQHNYPASGDRNTKFAADYIGKTPVVWSQDFGFAKQGDKDSYLSRPSIIQEAIRQHKLGSIINLCWHAVPPTAEEPVTFQPLPGADPNALASVQGRLTDKQFQDILTPGTKLYKQWLKQVDEIASFLKQLEEAKVPVLWRPYHEMNGDWFWWGGRYEGKYTTSALYRQIFNRFVNYHKLKNLVWVWSVDRPSRPGREFDKYYPGNQFLDILAIDVYGSDFNQSYYDGLVNLSQGKPVTLGEVGNPPSAEILAHQPGWVYWVIWAGMVRNTSASDFEKISADPRLVFMEDPAFINGTSEYRKACGLEPLIINRAADFTGTWMFNECQSNVQASGPAGTPYKLNVIQGRNDIRINASTVVEWSDDEVSDQTLPFDGSTVESVLPENTKRSQNAIWSVEKDSLTIRTTVYLKFGDRMAEVKSKEIWTLKNRGKKLVLDQTADGFMGQPERKSIIVYNKQ